MTRLGNEICMHNFYISLLALFYMEMGVFSPPLGFS